MIANRSVARLLLVVLFLFLTLPILTVLSLTVPALAWLWPVDTFIRSIPLVLAIVCDQIFGDGGELHGFTPLWVALTGALLWPLLVLGIRPVLWASRKWRRSILVYSGVALACTIVASGWMFTHTGYLF
jgi:hypothetical protein